MNKSTKPEQAQDVYFHMSLMFYLCRFAFDAGRWESHWPFGGSWSGSNWLEGVRLIRLVYSAVRISCQSYHSALGSHLDVNCLYRCGYRPIKVPWNICCLAPPAVPGNKLDFLSLLFKRWSNSWESEGPLRLFWGLFCFGVFHSETI